jgi:NAD(P)-dependent dehydrogenase (short-subunit alcohol dehydrogenase family)
MKLKNQVAIVTGASRGMGAEIALILAREGADVVLAARTVDDSSVAQKTRPGTISDVAARIRAMGRRALPVKTDVGVKADCERLVDVAIKEFGKVDILVNSAWFVNFTEAPLSDLMDSRMTDATMATFSGILDITRAVIPHMQAKKYGKIVNITSVGAKNKVPNAPVYAGLKAAVAHLSASVAMSLASEGIRVNCVAPGIIETPSTHDCFPTSTDIMKEMMIPMKKLGKETDIAEAVLFLVDDAASSYITGTTIAVDGGLSQG